MVWTKKDFAEAQKKYREKNKENEEYKRKRREYNKKWYLENREKHYQSSKESIKRWRERNRDSQVVIRQNSRAKTEYGKNTKISYNEWKEIKYKSPICPICKEEVGFEKLEMDHKIPMKDGGMHIKENIQAICRGCNARKDPAMRVK